MNAFDPDPQVLLAAGRPLGELVASWANSLATAAVVRPACGWMPALACAAVACRIRRAQRWFFMT